MAKVMLVEDDNNLREIYEARLSAEGYEIVAAKDGEEALALAVREKPDLIISDVMMPKISGFDMLDILRSTPETKFTKVIMMTALSQAEDKARGERLGADRYLVKSQVTLEDVARIAREVLNEDNPPAPEADPSPEPPAEPAPVTPSPAPAQPPIEPVADASAASTQTPAIDIQPAPQPAPDAPTNPNPDPPVAAPPDPAQPTDTSATTTSTPGPTAVPTDNPSPQPAANPDYTDLSQIIEEERSDVEQQIQNFVDKNPAPPANTPVAAVPNSVTDAPADSTPPTATTPQPSTPNPTNISVHEPPKPAPEPVKPAEEPANTPGEAPPPEIANKKLIQPPEHHVKDLETLLAEENSDQPINTPPATTVITPPPTAND